LGPAFQAQPAQWMGAKIGVYCVSVDAQQTAGHADFSHFTLGSRLTL
jgi:hypothetical protein